jgi:TetR/AcrR family transcriptional regulator, cholesterol catabolism regulator
MMFGNNTSKKKEYIAKVACDVFFAKGYAESSLQDIAAKGKLSKAGIYHYFKSKSDILSYILLGSTKNNIESLIRDLREAQEKKLPPQQILAVLIKNYAENTIKNHKFSSIVLRERHQLTKKSEAALLKQERSLFNIVRNQLRDVPNLNKKLDVNVISFQIISMIHWLGYWYDPKGSLPEKETIDQMIHITFNGILDSEKGGRV